MGMLLAQGIEFHAQKQHISVFGAQIVVRLCVFGGESATCQFLVDILNRIPVLATDLERDQACSSASESIFPFPCRRSSK